MKIKQTTVVIIPKAIVSYPIWKYLIAVTRRIRLMKTAKLIHQVVEPARPWICRHMSLKYSKKNGTKPTHIKKLNNFTYFWSQLKWTETASLISFSFPRCNTQILAVQQETQPTAKLTMMVVMQPVWMPIKGRISIVPPIIPFTKPSTVAVSPMVSPNFVSIGAKVCIIFHFDYQTILRLDLSKESLLDIHEIFVFFSSLFINGQVFQQYLENFKILNHLIFNT